MDEQSLMDGCMCVFFIHNLNEVSPYHDAPKESNRLTGPARPRDEHFNVCRLFSQLAPPPLMLQLLSVGLRHRHRHRPPACESAPTPASAMATATATNIINNRANSFSLLPIASPASADHASALAWCNGCNVANTAAAGASLHGRFDFQRPLLSPSSFSDGRRGGTRDGTVQGDHRERLRAYQGFSFFQRRPVIRFWDSFLSACFVLVGLGLRLGSLMAVA